MSEKNLIDRLFEAGSHFGFQKSRRHPTVSPYIYGSKDGTDIFDLEKTSVLIEDAKAFLKAQGESGKTLLLVGTKEEAKKSVRNVAEKIESPFVVNRWIGGTLTNFQEIKKRVARLKTLTEEGESGELERKYTKKERVVIGREADKLTFNFGGIKDMDRTPGVMLVVDPRHDSIAVQEATDLKIPVVAIMSSDCDASKVAMPVVVNDTLTNSIDLALDELTEAYTEGKKNYVPAPTRQRGDRNRNRGPRA